MADARKAAKLQRWVDLLATLLGRTFPATFDELAKDIPAYQEAKSKSALMRMFERDKDELRAFGVPIETVDDEDGERTAYRLARRDFYLPYLCVLDSATKRTTKPRKVDKFGYQALTTLTFDAEELGAVAGAAARVAALGDPLLAEEARSATRKLAFDLPLDAARAPDETTVLQRRGGADASVFRALSDALQRRKVVRFDYRTMSTDRTERRVVEPYGLFFVGATWYLAGRDHEREALRNFRLERITKPEVNQKKAQSADYDIPPEFRLRDHAGSRLAWELGDGEGVEAVIELRSATGAAAAAARLGRPVPGRPTHRAFTVRRIDAFARWVLSFGGDAMPIAPDEIVAAYREQLEQTIAVYDP